MSITSWWHHIYQVHIPSSIFFAHFSTANHLITTLEHKLCAHNCSEFTSQAAILHCTVWDAKSNWREFFFSNCHILDINWISKRYLKKGYQKDDSKRILNGYVTMHSKLKRKRISNGCQKDTSLYALKMETKKDTKWMTKGYHQNFK